MKKFSSILIGSEALLAECGQVLRDRGHSIAAVVTRTPALASWARERGIRVEAPGPDLTARLAGVEVDWLLSITNLSLIPADTLALAQRGAINFHDGPLPAYGGLNAPVWALMSGETEYGITWHMIAEGIDTGDIVMQRRFPIDPDETAFSLNVKCFAAAIESFRPLVEAIETGSFTAAPQDFTHRTIFMAADRPAAAGRVDFGWPAGRIAGFVRALDHEGHWNPLTTPKVDLGGVVASIGSARIADGPADAPGTVLAVDATEIVVATADGAVALSGLTDPAGVPISPAKHARMGDRLPALSDGEVLTWALAAAAPYERSVRPLLLHPAPCELGLAGPARSEAVVAEAPLALPARASTSRLATIVAATALRGTGRHEIDLAYAGDAPQCPPGYLSGWAPVRFAAADDIGVNALEGAVAAQLAKARPAFALDIVVRDPAISTVRVPELALSRTAEPGLVPGTALTVHLSAAGARLFYDSTRMSAEAAALFADRLASVANAIDDEPDIAVGALPLLSDRERDLVTRAWNRTAAEYDRELTLHGAFQAQAARTPDAIALVFDGQEMSYASLDARSNQLAHVLGDMGAGPGRFVGLQIDRSLELVIAGLAILKTGAAYVPLDPAYPDDRIALYVEDSGADIIVTSRALAGRLPAGKAERLIIDSDPRIDAAPTGPSDGTGRGRDAAYLIYTSGSTGRPKGVVLEHRNVANFFRGMDDRIEHDPAGTWLAVTSLSFDISVLELFYTLARGFKVVIASNEARLTPSDGIARSEGGMQFSLFYWGNDDGAGPKKYELLLEGAKFADANGFCAVWTPERHFHAFGGPYPNPSVTGAAVAAVTQNIGVRAGSCVAPLHHVARIAEEWAVIDNLTNGRAGLAIASGWQPDDFLLRPENAPPNNKAAMLSAIDTLRKLWRGEAVAFDRPLGGTIDVITQPRPVSKEVPIWVTTAGNPETWKEAGRIGANVLTHLLGQSIAEVAEKIGIYHEALREAGYDPAERTVTLMLHTYLAADRETAREVAREPMKDYLRSAAALIKQYAWAFPAFKKPQGVNNPMQIDLGSMDAEEMDAILEFAFRRYFEDSGLFGTVEDAVQRVEELKAIGVDEIACLIDYGIPVPTVLEGLKPLAEVLSRTNLATELNADDFSIAAQIRRHGVTHLQCTPSMARLLLADPGARSALGRVKNIMIGGEALPGQLARELSGITGRPIQNMYGPTETTIWSSTERTTGDETVVNIGLPIANTSFYVLDDAQRPVPVGVPGELWIGGDGVAREYWQRPDLTAERFRPDPFAPSAGGRMYRTGDLVKWRPDGRIDFLGRADNQLKIRGYRIELGEIEATLEMQDGIRQAVVVAREDNPGDVRLVAYCLADGRISADALRSSLSAKLPEFMVPAHFVQLDAFPLTPNKKVDRKALPAPAAVAAPVAAPAATPAREPEKAVAPQPARPAAAPAAQTTPAGNVEEQIAAVWKRILGVPTVTAKDNFFALGGHSLLAVQAHRELKAVLGSSKLSITDIFRFPTLGALANHIEPSAPREAAPVAVPEASNESVTPAQSRAQMREDAMARRRAMRAGRKETT
jgi:natural product biosynthesis luciferase-like monooxygenase protein